MAYVSAERAYYDADSHIMELPNFLKAYADPELRDDIPEVSYSASVVTNEEVEVRVVGIRKNMWPPNSPWATH